MAIDGIHDVVPKERFPNEGMSVPRFALNSEVYTIDLLDDITGNVIAQYDSSNVLVASEPDVESASPTHRFGISGEILTANLYGNIFG